MRELEPAEDHSVLPEHVTTPLLTLITARSLDEDYAHVAQRRGTSDATRPSPRRMRWATVVAVGVFGSLIAVAAVQTSRGAELEELSRAALTERIESRRAELGGLQATVADLSRSNQALTTRVGSLTRQQDDMRPILERLEVRTGFTAVQGEGLRITLDNRPAADVGSELRDEDVAMLVDALWAAGAEAVAVNDQRINVLGGIRNSSRAIHVNGNPLRAPYVVSVIGDNATLQSRLSQTSQGQAFQTLANTLGFRYEVDNVDDVRLPAAPLRPLRHARESDDAPGGEDSAP